LERLVLGLQRFILGLEVLSLIWFALVDAAERHAAVHGSVRGNERVIVRGGDGRGIDELLVVFFEIAQVPPRLLQ